MQASTTVRNAILDQIETTIGVSALIKYYDGTMPANCGTARAGTVVASITAPSDWMANASGGVKAKSGTLEDTSADNTGLIRYYSVFDSSGATCHLQGLCGQTWVISTAYVLNQHVVANGNVYKCTTAGTSAGSGTGPSGTGSGITDNTAVWAYVGASEMVIDNTNVVAGQDVLLSTLSWTAPMA